MNHSGLDCTNLIGTILARGKLCQITPVSRVVTFYLMFKVSKMTSEPTEQSKLKTVFKLDHSFIKLCSWLYLNISTKLQIYQLFSILQHPKTSIMPPYSVMIRANFRQRSTLTHAHAHTHTNWNYLHTCSKRLHTNRKCLVFIILYGLYCCTQGHHDFYFCFTFVRGCYFFFKFFVFIFQVSCLFNVMVVVGLVELSCFKLLGIHWRYKKILLTLL